MDIFINQVQYFELYSTISFVDTTAAVNSNTITSRKSLPIGLGSVEECNEANAIYVDKTEFALKLIKSRGRSFLFLRPRRFGKTFFLNTLESILRGKQDVFKNYFIGNPQNGYGWEVHRVLRLTFQTVDPINTLAERLVGFAKLSGVDEAFAHIENTNPLYFAKLLRALSPNDELGNPKPGNVPLPALLIDEYDLPFKNSDPDIRKYFHSIFTILKKLTDERIVRLVFFTGCNKVNLFADYTNTTQSGLSTTLGIEDISLDSTYATMCGFTEEEIEKNFGSYVHDVAAAHNVTSDVIYKEMEDWYDGYHFTRNSRALYNPISLLYYLKDVHILKPGNYWIRTQGHPKTAMEALIAARVRAKIIILDLKTGYTPDQLFQPTEDHAVNSELSLESILFQNGYLTIREHNPTTDLYTLKFPNVEITEAFMRGVKIAVAEDNDYITLHKKAKSSLQNLNVDEFVETYNIFLNSHYKLETEINSKECEAFLKSLMEILLKIDPLSRDPTPEWNVQREAWTKKSSGKGGEIDFLIETLNYRIIIESKFEATRSQWKEAYEQAANYRFPSSESQRNSPLVRLVFNFNGNGIIQWMGTEHDVEEKFVRMLVQDPMEKSNHISEHLNK